MSSSRNALTAHRAVQAHKNVLLREGNPSRFGYVEDNAYFAKSGFRQMHSHEIERGIGSLLSFLFCDLAFVCKSNHPSSPEEFEPMLKQLLSLLDVHGRICVSIMPLTWTERLRSYANSQLGKQRKVFDLDREIIVCEALFLRGLENVRVLQGENTVLVCGSKRA